MSAGNTTGAQARPARQTGQGRGRLERFRVAKAPELAALEARWPEEAGWFALYRGLLHEGAGRLPEALLHYRLAAQHDGLDWQPWLRMAHLHARLGQRARVAEDVRRALELRAGLEEVLPAGA